VKKEKGGEKKKERKTSEGRAHDSHKISRKRESQVDREERGKMEKGGKGGKLGKLAQRKIRSTVLIFQESKKE